jgi:hypothetical protein
MPALHYLNVNFNGGELTPLMNGRVDFEGYRSGCVQMENFMVRPYGGAFKAPGTQYLGEVKNSAKKVRLVPLKVSRDENYVFEIGEGYIRFFKEDDPARLRLRSGYSVPAWAAGGSYVRGQLVTNGGTTYVCIKDHFYASGAFSGVAANFYALTSATFYNLSTGADQTAILMEWPNSYTEAELASLQWKQLGRSVVIVQQSHPPLIIESVSTDSDNAFIAGAAWSDAASTDPDYSFMVGEAEFTFPPLTEHELSSTGATVTITESFPNWAVSTVYAASTSAAPVLVLRNHIVYSCILGHTSSATDQPLLGANWETYWKPYRAENFENGSYSLSSSPSSIESALNEGDVIVIEAATASVVLPLSSYPTEPSVPVFLQGGFTVSTEWQAGQAPICTIYLYQSVDGGLTWDRIIEWVTSSVNAGSIFFEDKAPPQGAWYRLNADITTDRAGASVKLEPTVTRLLIPFKVKGTGVAPLLAGGWVPVECVDVAATTFYRSSFSSENGYPSAIGLHNLRLWFGGTAKEPNVIRASNVDDYFNFALGDNDGDGMQITLNSTEANLVRWIASYRQGLVVGTDGEEWTVQGAGDGSEVLTPSNIQAIQRNRSGTSALAAIQTRDSLLWVSLTGRKVFEFSYAFTSDDYKSPDMTLRAEHITKSGIVDFAFQAEPDPVLWCVLANGTLLGFSYNRENQIAAWFRRTTSGGLFESIATVRSDGDSDRVWMVVKRTINGSTKRYIERFYPTAQEFDFDDPTDFCYIDCAKKITATGTAVSGLGHLEAASIALRVDGIRTETKTVASGAVTLTTAAVTNLFAGIPIASVLQPEPIEQILQDGTAQGRRFNAQRIQLLLHASIGGTVSDDPALSGDAIGYPAFATTGGGAIVPHTGRIEEHIRPEWKDAIELTFKHSDPVPFNLLGFVLKAEISGQ